MKREDVEIAVAQNQTDFDGMMVVRRQVFVDEQNIPENQEFDGNDFGATHILAKIGGKVIGTMRVRYFSDFVKFERMAVLKPYRKSDVSDKIMNKGFEFVARKGYQKVYGVCKKELLPRWKECGYEPIAGVPVLQHNGMSLIPIMRELPKDPKALTIKSHPELLTAKEDTWDSIALPQDRLIMLAASVKAKFSK